MYSKTKENKLFGDASKTIEKYFVCVLDAQKKLPNYERFNLKPVSIRDFKSVFEKALPGVKVKTDLDRNKLKKIEAWISDPSKSHIEQTVNQDTQLNQSNHKTEKLKDKLDEKKQFNKNDLLKAIDFVQNIGEGLKFSFNNIVSLEKETDRLNNIINDYRTQMNSKQNEIKELTKYLETAKSDLEKAKEEICKVTSELNVYMSDNQIKDKEIEKLKNEIEKQNSVLSVFSEDKQNAQSAQLNSIASKLRAEYLDFQDATEMEMTIDLGENLREQIKSIFKILSKSGINADRR